METNVLNGYRIIFHVVLIVLIILLLLACILFYQYFYEIKNTPVVENVPTSIGKGFELISLDKKGQLIYRFLAPHFIDYNDQQHTEFQSPLGYFYQADAPYWTLSAQKAVAERNGNIVHLLGNVKIHQDAGKTNPNITLSTSEITLYPKQKIAFNDVLTTVTQPGITLTTVGFHANFKTNEIQLLSHPNAQYSTTGNEAP